MTHTPADFAREAWDIVVARADSARYSGPSLESLFTAAMAQASARAQVLALSISDDHDAALRWAKRWKRAAKLGYSFEAERARVAAARAECATSPLRDAVALTIGRLRGAADASAMVYGGHAKATALRSWADQLERALEQEGRG